MIYMYVATFPAELNPYSPVHVNHFSEMEIKQKEIQSLKNYMQTVSNLLT